ncbi:Helicase domino [Orchesella cincta]|uniref:Helicase domino n=1 Tax=Orchesella cincta TaxID=48709 RepID=A0A1D2NA60_ORCCI|nr:Helicase domino [Orchesella cincta]
MDVLTRYVMYIPAVSAPSLEGRFYRPPCSSMYLEHVQQLENYRKNFTKPTEIVHPVMSRMLTQFPDPRLIQYDCGKLQTLDTLLRKLKTGSHRVLIFTQMAKVLDILESFLNCHGHTYLRLDGATKIDQRQLLMERFNADTKIFCFILSTRSGGVGVNLTGADTVIFYDSDWNPTMDAQAQDRCHRIGQTRDVHIYRLVSEKTVEENILKKSNQKRLLGELAIEDGKFTTAYFKQNTIRDLFTINEKDDVAKRLSTWNTDEQSTPLSTVEEEDESTTFDSSDLMKSLAKKHEIQTIECALAVAEDDTDVHAAQTVHAEAEAEMAEFDENVSLDALDDQWKAGPNKFEIEFQQIFERMTDVERYAMRLMELTIGDWLIEAINSSQKDRE